MGSWLNIRLQHDGTFLKVYTPYHPTLVARCRQWGGKWDGEAWVFPDTPDHSHKVKETLLNIWGWDGEKEEVEVVDVEVDFSSTEYVDFIFGREVKRPSRDSRLRVGWGVEVLEEPGGGGSRKHPAIEWAKLLVRCVPTERLNRPLPKGVKILAITNRRTINVPIILAETQRILQTDPTLSPASVELALTYSLATSSKEETPDLVASSPEEGTPAPSPSHEEIAEAARRCGCEKCQRILAILEEAS